MSLYDISLKAAVLLVCALFCGGLYFLALVLFKVPSSKTTRAIRQIGPRNRPTPDGISQLYNNAAQFLSKILPMSKYREQQLEQNLKIAHITMPPKLYEARAIFISVRPASSSSCLSSREDIPISHVPSVADVIPAPEPVC